jgi:hypothetical protein
MAIRIDRRSADGAAAEWPTSVRAADDLSSDPRFLNRELAEVRAAGKR